MAILNYENKLDQAKCDSRTNVSGYLATGKIECPLLPLVLGMEVRGAVIIVVHLDDDTEKYRDCWYWQTGPYKQ